MTTRQTWRNTNRTNHRANAAMTALLSEIPSVRSTSFHYQYCAARRCRQVEVAIAEHEISGNFTPALQQSLASAGVAVMRVEHAKEDVRQRYPIAVHTSDNSATTMSWDDLAILLLTLHQTHVATSRINGCTYTNKRLGFARDSAIDEDLSISNVLRDVPGVRHLDVDTLVLCPDCGQSRLLLESTSDGYLNDERKMTYMSERVATLLGADFALVQHPPGGARIDKVIVTRSVRLGRGYTKSTSVMARAEFQDWLVSASQHACAEVSQ